MTYGFSRDDAGKSITNMCHQILGRLSIQTVDKDGGQTYRSQNLVEVRKNKWSLWRTWWRSKSIEFFHEVGLDYVSCSPFRVPIAQLAAAQSTIKYDTIKGEVFS